MDTIAVYAISAVILGIPLLFLAAWLFSALVECLTVVVNVWYWIAQRLLR